MVVFDLDGTLTSVDSLWRYLHEAFGTWDQGKDAAHRYLNGEISYKEWAETDSRLWAGVLVSKVASILEKIPYRDGAQGVFNELRRKGVKTVILSAGLSILADKAASDLGADLAFANELQTNDGRLTGEINVKVAVNEKNEIIKRIASSLDIPLKEVALVGDRGFDLANEECLRIAFMPKDEVAKHRADFIVEDEDLKAILQYL